MKPEEQKADDDVTKYMTPEAAAAWNRLQERCKCTTLEDRPKVYGPPKPWLTPELRKLISEQAAAENFHMNTMRHSTHSTPEVSQ